MSEVTLVLGDGSEVVVREHLSFAMKTRLDDAKMTMRVGDGGGDFQLTPQKYAEAIVERCVVSWTVRGIDGEPVDATVAGVRSANMGWRVMEAVVEAVEKHYGLDKDEDPKG